MAVFIVKDPGQKCCMQTAQKGLQIIKDFYITGGGDGTFLAGFIPVKKLQNKRTQ
jgi:hypothetical protein